MSTQYLSPRSPGPFQRREFFSFGSSRPFDGILLGRRPLLRLLVARKAHYSSFISPCNIGGGIPIGRRVRQLHRHRPHRGVLRRRGAPPAFSRRRSSTQLLPARHGHRSSPPQYLRKGLLPAETIRGQESQRSHALPETPPVRHRVPTADPRCRHKRRAREDTRGRLYRLARPADTPHTGSSDKSLPEPATKPYNPAKTDYLTQRGASIGSSPTGGTPFGQVKAATPGPSALEYAG